MPGTESTFPTPQLTESSSHPYKVELWFYSLFIGEETEVQKGKFTGQVRVKSGYEPGPPGFSYLLPSVYLHSQREAQQVQRETNAEDSSHNLDIESLLKPGVKLHTW